MDLEEAKVKEYLLYVIKLLYESVLHVREIESWEGGAGVTISPHEESYDDNKILVKVNGSTVTILNQNNSINDFQENIGLEDPKSFERLWKILNSKVMKMIDSKVKQNTLDLRESQEKVNQIMTEQFALLLAKSEVVNKMVTNPTIIEFEDLNFDMSEPEKVCDDGTPF